MTSHRLVAWTLAIGLAGAVTAPAAAQDAVLQAVGVRVAPGQMDAYLGKVRSLQGVIDRLETSGHVEIWQTVAAGDNVGTTLVVIEHPSLVAFAESTTKTQSDADYATLLGGLDAIRTLEGSSLYRQIGGAPSPGDIATGSILQTVGVRVEPGRLDDYVARVAELQKISEGLGLKSRMRVWQATAAGPATGTVVVGVLYPDLAAYAADSTALQGSAEWQTVVGSLDDLRTIVSTTLSRNVGP